MVLSDYFKSEKFHVANSLIEAGKLLVSLYGQEQEVFYKNNDLENPSVKIEKIAQKKVIEQIIKKVRVSDLEILAEEGAREIKESYERLLVLDPLDGTQNYINFDKRNQYSDRNEQFYVMGGVMNADKKVEYGMAYNPLSKELYYGGEEEVFKININTGNYEEISFKNVNNLSDMVAVKGIGSRKSFIQTKKSLGIKENNKIIGSTGGKICYLSSGKADFFYSNKYNLKIWDLLPVYPILKNAGGRISVWNEKEQLFKELDFNQALKRKDFSFEKPIVVSSKKVHDEVLSIISNNLLNND